MHGEKNIKFGVLISYFSIFVNLIISAVFTPFFLHSLGNQQYGLYTMGTSVVSFLNLTEFGLNSTLIYYISKHKSKEKKLAATYGLFICMFCAIALFILMLGSVICFFSEELFVVSTGADGYKQLKIIIMIMVVNLACTFFFQPFSAMVNAYEHFIYAQGINLLFIILKPVILIPFLLGGHKAITVALVYFVLSQIVNITNVIYAKYKIGFRVSFEFSILGKNFLKEVVKYSFFIFLSMIATQLNENVDNLILGITSGEIVVGVYSLGYQLSAYVSCVPNMLLTFLFPRIIKMVTDGAKKEELTESMVRVGRIQWLFLLLIVSGFVCFGRDFVRLWAGTGYEDVYWIVLALVVPAVISNTQGIGVLILQSKNKHKFKANISLILALVNVAISYPVGKQYGAIGCALCTGLVCIISTIAMNWYYTKMELDIKQYWKAFVKILSVSVPVWGIGWILNCLLPICSWMYLVIKIMIFVLFYCIYMGCVGVNQYEKALLKSYFLKGRRE